jgi:hypothetical protein
MKFIGLVFDYDLGKLSSIGRKWAGDIYRNKYRIFEYSAASIASVLHTNPQTEYRVYTDDVDFLFDNIRQYNVPTNNLTLVDWSSNLAEWKQHRYPFYCAMMLMKHNCFIGKEDIVKLDNDLICKREFLPNMTSNTSIIWKFEGMVCDGDDRTGEKHIAQVALGDTNFSRYNMGVLGLCKDDHYLIDDVISICEQLVNVDISKITDVDSSIYHCCEQTAYNWIFHKKNFSVIQSYDVFDHYFADKSNCMMAMSNMRIHT